VESGEDSCCCGSFELLLAFETAPVPTPFPNEAAYRLSALPLSLISFHLSKYLADKGFRIMSPLEEDTWPPDLKNKIFLFNASAACLRFSI
jgi:hypothetical protein